MDYTVDQIKVIVARSREVAKAAAAVYLQNRYGGRDTGACGFAWVTIDGIKGNTKLGRTLKAAGVQQAYDRSFQIWNPSGLHVQNIDTLEAGANAAAQYLRDQGFNAYAGSRLD